jgi:hypothetical protein
MKQSPAITAALGEHTLTITIKRSLRSGAYIIGTSTSHPTGPHTMYVGCREADPRLMILDAVKGFMDSTSAQLAAADEFLAPDEKNDDMAKAYYPRGHMYEEFALALGDLKRLAEAEADTMKAEPPPPMNRASKGVPKKASKRSPPAAVYDNAYPSETGAGPSRPAGSFESMAMTGDSVTAGLPALNPELNGLVDGVALKTPSRTKKKRKIAKKPAWR